MFQILRYVTSRITKSKYLHIFGGGYKNIVIDKNQKYQQYYFIKKNTCSEYKKVRKNRQKG